MTNDARPALPREPRNLEQTRPQVTGRVVPAPPDLEELFKRWRKPMRQWLSHRCSFPSADLDDICQEVFLRLLRYRDDMVMDNPQAYIFRIASNCVNEWAARPRLRKPHYALDTLAGGHDANEDDPWLELIDAACNPEEAADRDSIDRHVRLAVSRLPARQRQIFCMHVLDGLTYKQISAQLGVTYRLVLRDLTRAYTTLRMELHG